MSPDKNCHATLIAGASLGGRTGWRHGVGHGLTGKAGVEAKDQPVAVRLQLEVGGPSRFHRYHVRIGQPLQHAGVRGRARRGFNDGNSGRDGAEEVRGQAIGSGVVGHLQHLCAQGGAKPLDGLQVLRIDAARQQHPHRTDIQADKPRVGGQCAWVGQVHRWPQHLQHRRPGGDLSATLCGLNRGTVGTGIFQYRLVGRTGAAGYQVENTPDGHGIKYRHHAQSRAGPWAGQHCGLDALNTQGAQTADHRQTDSRRATIDQNRLSAGQHKYRSACPAGDDLGTDVPDLRPG